MSQELNARFKVFLYEQETLKHNVIYRERVQVNQSIEINHLSYQKKLELILG